jgi:hypothetical protein
VIKADGLTLPFRLGAELWSGMEVLSRVGLVAHGM